LFWASAGAQGILRTERYNIYSFNKSHFSPVRAKRREKILDAAEKLFVADGVRATTMEGLAASAEMSKVTVYGYFIDKDEVFSAVSDRVATRMERVFLDQIEGEGDVSQRIAKALISKHKLVHELVRESAHAKELFAAKNTTNAERFHRLDQLMIASIAKALPATIERPKELATVLFDASQGIANGADRFDVVARRIWLLMALVEGGE